MSDVPGAPPSASATAQRSALIDQMGGMRGLIDGGLSALVFVTVNIAVGLMPAAIAAVATGVVLLAVRALRREPVRQALMGFVALGIAAFIAAKSGRQEGFFLPGIVGNFFYAGVLALSALLRHPLVGHALAALEDRGPGWRRDRPLRRVYARATVAWALYFLVRASIALALYDAASSVGLLVHRLLGIPMILLGAALTVAYTRRATARLEQGAPSPAG